MRRTPLLPLALLLLLLPALLLGCPTDEAETSEEKDSCTAVAIGLVLLELPAKPVMSELTVFAMKPDAVSESGVPNGKPVADVVVDMTAGEAALSFPIGFQLCAEEGDFVLVAAVDTNGDSEIFGPGDYIGHTRVPIPSGGASGVKIALNRELTAADGKKGDKPKE
jgi:hypothetical protein